MGIFGYSCIYSSLILLSFGIGLLIWWGFQKKKGEKDLYKKWNFVVGITTLSIGFILIIIGLIFRKKGNTENTDQILKSFGIF
jgi:hypothetical protein